MATNDAVLNSETSEPQERAELELPPKSYADALTIPEKQQEDQQNVSKRGPQNGITSDSSSSIAQKKKVNGTKKSQSSETNGVKEMTDEDRIKYEKHRARDGSVLTSIKADEDYEASLRHDKESAPREAKKSNNTKKRPAVQRSQLSSGRKAGEGWERSAIRWAPLNVPLQRRIQTLAVLFHTTSIALFLSFFFLMCAIPLTWPLLVPYLIYTLIWSDEATSGSLRRRSPRLRRAKFWSAFASYYPARLHRTQKLEPTRKYIFGYHPHGIIALGSFAAFATEALGFSELFPGITNTLLTLDSNFRIPFYRDYALAMGLASVSRESIENLLSHGGTNGEGMGRAVTIVVGGARESLDAHPHTMELVLNSRKGFVKLAIRQGADLVPVLAFGENELYDQVDSDEHPWIHRAQLTVKQIMGFTIPLFHARGIFNYDVGLMPYRKPINIVVGKPIPVAQQGGSKGGEGSSGAVDPAYLDKIHAEYVAELKALWDTHKDTFARDRQGELEIVE